MDRLAGERGFCGVGLLPKVAAVSVHHGEEPPITGTRGAGNIFFSGCNLRCLFCQNYPISQMGVGREMAVEELATAMLSLQSRGAHNINLVTATHVMPQAAAAVDLARGRGLALPVIHNTNGYEKPDVIKLQEKVVDVWLPDMKYASEEVAGRLSGVWDYVSWNRRAVEAMVRMAGPLELDGEGLARRGVIVRHLVLPARLSGTREIISYLVRNYGRELPMACMCQYFPAHRAVGDPQLGRRLTGEEWEEALEWIEEAGITGGWVQEYG